MQIVVPAKRAKKSPIIPVTKIVTDDFIVFAIGIQWDFFQDTGFPTGSITVTDLWGSKITFMATKLKFSLKYFAIEVIKAKKKNWYCFKPVMVKDDSMSLRAIPPKIKFGETAENVEIYPNEYAL